MNYQTIIRFWFKELETKHWFAKNPQLDQLITARFSEFHLKATKGELFHWRVHPLGRLAEILLLDQFSRNIYRDRPAAFAYDAQALTLSQEAITLSVHRNFNKTERMFLYMPFMHSESIVIHNLAMELFKEPGMEWNLEFEIKHREIIERFGRYPHRNSILGRPSTQDEIEFLKSPGSSF